MSTRRQQTEPTFIWQALLIILPVIFLVLTGVYTLRKDRSLAIEEARTRANSLLNPLTQQFGNLLYGQILELTMDQHEWLNSQLRIVQEPMSSRLPAVARERTQSPSIPTEIYESRYLKFNLERLGYRSHFSLSEWVHLVDLIAPVAPPWLLGLSDVERTLWTILESAVLGTSATAVQKASGAFQPGVVDEHARLNGEWLRLRWEFKHVPRTRSFNDLLDLASRCREVPSASGLPLSTLVLIEALRHARDSGFPDRLWTSLAEEVSNQNGLQISMLLDELDRVAVSNAEVRVKAVALRRIWEFRRERRSFIETLRETALRDFAAPGQTNLWLSGPTGQVLVLARSGFALVQPAELPNRPIVEIQCLPEELLGRAVPRALKEAALEFPAYFGVKVQIAGQSVREVQSADSNPYPLGIREVFLNWHLRNPVGSEPANGQASPAPEGYQGVPLRLEMLLTDKAQLFAIQDKRQRLYGALFAVSFAAACLGLIGVRRTFVQQQRLVQLKDNFVSSVSHELRAPIASIRLMAESLETERIKDPVRQRDYFRLMSRECRRLSSMIANVLDFSRIEQGRKEYQFEPTDLAALVRDTCLLMQPYAAEHRVTLETRVSQIEDGFCLDGKAVQQALINLVDNAIKHSPVASAVVVGLEDSPWQGSPGVALWVADHGPGIPEDEHQRIFERFYRVGSELTRETSGVGIGLSIVKHVVEAHGGSITVRSAPGQGSRFTLHFGSNHSLSQGNK